MKKTSQQIKAAFEAGTKKTVNNTATDGTFVTLFDNRIIQRGPDGVIQWRLAGWNTTTTRERLNGILGLGLRCRAGVAYLGTQKIDDCAWYTLSGVKLIK